MPRYPRPPSLKTAVPVVPERRRACIANRCGFALLLAAVGAPVGAWAQPTVEHEFVPDVDPDEPLRTLLQFSNEPAAVVYEGELLGPPDLSAAPEMPPMVPQPGDGQGAEQPGQRSPEFRPDRLTSLERGLDYYASFNPSVAPFKRVTSLDAVRLAADGETPILTLSARGRTQVAVIGADTPASDGPVRERFWGEADLDFTGASVLPLPSVAPDARILSLRSQPAVALHIERDGAGNFYAVADGPVGGGLVRLSFLTDADSGYFGRPIPALPVGVMAARVPELPASVRRRGLRFARELGLTSASDLRTAIHALVAHFRAFEESDEPPVGDDIYLALARGRRGICRHRAYAFVITAQSLGIPAHFVQNEAHSWVEVLVADAGYLRIDLGGAADGMRAHGLDRRVRHRPQTPDDLPRPPAYERAYAAANAALGAGQRDGAASAAAAGQWLPTRAGDGTTAISGAGRAASGAEEMAAIAEAQRDPRAPLQVRVRDRALRATRGKDVAIAGSVVGHDGQPVPNMRIEISLAAPDRKERMLLGVTLTDASGAFQGRFPLPADLALGDYQLVVLTPGDAEHQPAVAE